MQQKPTAMISPYIIIGMSMIRNIIPCMTYDPECNLEHDSALNIKIAREQLSETDEVSYYLGLGMSLWYTGTEEYIEGRNCPVFVLGTDHEDHFTKEHYYAVGDNVVYYYDPSGDAWLLYAFIPGSHWCIGEVYW